VVPLLCLLTLSGHGGENGKRWAPVTTRSRGGGGVAASARVRVAKGRFASGISPASPFPASRVVARGRGRWCGSEWLAPVLSSSASSASASGTTPVMLLLTWPAVEVGRWERANRRLPDQVEASGSL
jgi:hypothetical protein